MKTKSDILIKVLSLGIGLAVGIVLIAKVFFELSYDSFYRDIDRVYTIRTWYSQHGDEHDYGQVSGAVLVLLIVLGVVLLNCLRIARANPVESLKNE